MIREIVGKSRLSARDLLTEAAATIRMRPTRSILTTLGTVIGVGAFVATTGLADTARAQVSSRFDALKATEVRVEEAEPGAGYPFPIDVDERLEDLNGVNHAGVYWTVPATGLGIRTLPNRLGSVGAAVSLLAASPGAVRAMIPHVAVGRLFDRFHDVHSEQVAVLGAEAARRLGISRIDNQPAIFVGDTAYTIVGIVDTVERNPDVLTSVIVPSRTALRLLPMGTARFTVIVDTRPGAARLIGSQAALALRPDQPEVLRVLMPLDPNSLREGVESDVTGLFYGLAGLALLIGMIGIANATLVAVIERRGEIGLRRALGAKPRHIACQVLAESSTLGLAGGVIGAALGILAVVAISASNAWTTTLNFNLTLSSPMFGALTGLLAGLQPARRAACTEPADALRAT